MMPGALSLGCDTRHGRFLSCQARRDEATREEPFGETNERTAPEGRGREGGRERRPCIPRDRGRPLHDDCGGRAASPEKVLPELVDAKDTWLTAVWFARAPCRSCGSCCRNACPQRPHAGPMSSARRCLRWWRNACCSGGLSYARCREIPWPRSGIVLPSRQRMPPPSSPEHSSGREPHAVWSRLLLGNAKASPPSEATRRSL